MRWCEKQKKMKNRTTTFERSFRLKELGVSQVVGVGDYFYNRKELSQDIDDGYYLHYSYENESLHVAIRAKYDYEGMADLVDCKAFDGAQIDSALPICFDFEYYLFLNFGFDGVFSASYLSPKKGVLETLRVTGKTLLKAKTNLLIKLIENGYLAANEVNLKL